MRLKVVHISCTVVIALGKSRYTWIWPELRSQPAKMGISDNSVRSTVHTVPHCLTMYNSSPQVDKGPGTTKRCWYSYAHDTCFSTLEIEGSESDSSWTSRYTKSFRLGPAHQLQPSHSMDATNNALYQITVSFKRFEGSLLHFRELFAGIKVLEGFSFLVGLWGKFGQGSK